MHTNSNAAMNRLPRKGVAVKASLRNQVSEPRELTREQAEKLAADVFDEALIRAGIGTEEAGLIIGVSKATVSKWRSEHYQEQPTLAHLLRLPSTFQYAMHKVASRRFGFGRAALLLLLEAAEDVAVELDEKVG